MSTKFKTGIWLFGSVAVLLLVAVAIHWARAHTGSQDPLYRGRRLSLWLDDLVPPSSGAQLDTARAAVWSLGTNALVPLPNMLRAQDFLPTQLLIRLNQFGAGRSPLRFHIRTAVEKHIRAQAVYGLLGPLAMSDVPVLSTRLRKEKSPQVRVQMAEALHNIHPVGPDGEIAIASLTEATRDIDPQVRSCSILALLVISSDREPLVPVLIERLADPATSTRGLAISGLLGIGEPAIAALRDSRRTNDVAAQILREMKERKRHPEGQPRIRYL